MHTERLNHEAWKGKNKMSWSVSATGKPVEVQREIGRQMMLGPLAEPPAGLADEGERETVRLVSFLVYQCLGTFDPEGVVTVEANGHMAFSNWDSRIGARQTVSIAITPRA